MTQKRIMRVSKTQPLSGSISTASYAFVFSDDVNDWQSSKKIKKAEYSLDRYHKLKDL